MLYHGNISGLGDPNENFFRKPENFQCSVFSRTKQTETVKSNYRFFDFLKNTLMKSYGLQKPFLLVCFCPNPAVPRISFATRFAHIFAHIFATGNEFQIYFSARRNSFDLTQNSVKAVLTVSNLIMMRTYVFR